ncbi:MAG TPA: DUF4157 domain-containing protein [Longimicrobium sp.]|nr:DUF4157 domain-containing protein [Longimicrobium sp.]
MRPPRPAVREAQGQDALASPPPAHQFARVPVFAPAPVRVQAQPRTSMPGDAHEREAEHAAAQVMHAPGGESLQGEAGTRDGGAGRDAAPAAPLPGGLGAAAGARLDPATRAFMEPRLGHDFSRVRIHTGTAAASSAESLSARAYTVGSHVVFGAGQYQPHTPAGRRLLAHELAHVVQQGGGTPTRGGPHGVAVRSAAAAGQVQRDAELDAEQTKNGLAAAKKAIEELEATAAKSKDALPEYIRDAIKLLRAKLDAGQIKIYAFEGLKHGQFKGDEIRLDGATPDAINVTTVLHEGVHAAHKGKYPKLGKRYADAEGKQVSLSDPGTADLLRWKAWTEYWAYRARLDYFNPSSKEPMTEEQIHKTTLQSPDVRVSLLQARKADPDFDPRTWKPKG